MNKFRHLLAATITAAAIIASLDASAQFGGSAGNVTISAVPSATAASVSTNFVVGQGTNNTVSPVNIYNAHNVSFSLTTAGVAGGTTKPAATAIWVRSVDGVNWETNTSFLTLSVTGGSNAVPATVVSNVDIGAVQFISLWGFTANAASTNNAVSYGIKPGF